MAEGRKMFVLPLCTLPLGEWTCHAPSMPSANFAPSAFSNVELKAQC